MAPAESRRSQWQTLDGEGRRNSMMNLKVDDDEEEVLIEADEEIQAPGCGICARYPVLSVICGAALGVAIGIGLSFWVPDDDDGMQTKQAIVRWVGLIGDLFIRSLKCVVLPMVFISVMISIVDMLSLGKAGAIAKKTVIFYLITTIFAAFFGVVSILIFQGFYSTKDLVDAGPSLVKLGCNAYEEGFFLTEQDDGSLICLADPANTTDQEFVIEDVTKTFATGGEDFAQVSISDTFYEGIFLKIVPDNIVGSFADGNFVAVIFLGALIGLALGKILAKKGADFKSVLMPFLDELLEVFVMFINWIIMFTPLAVVSLIAAAIGNEENLEEAFGNVGWLIISVIFGMVLHICCVYCGLYLLLTRSNPLDYLKHLFPAQMMAFSCASSAATIPVTFNCVRSTKVVPDAVARFVVPLGATVNMDGGAIYFPVACVWLATLNGIEPSTAQLLLLVIVSAFGSVGSAPVPSAGLVLVITGYNTVFNTTGVPDGFSFVVAIDWFLDRLITAMNVTGDSVVAGIIAKTTAMDDDATLEDKGEPLEEKESAKA